MSKLGAGIYENTNEAIQTGLEFRGPLLLYETALDAARDIRATVPGRLIIGRIRVDDEQQGWLRSIEPAEYGRRLANRLLYHPANPYVDGWQSLNEINDPELRKAQAEFDYAFALTMLQARKQAVIGNFSVGHFNAEESLDWTLPFHPPNVWLGYHAYWTQDGPDMMGQWLAFRYRLWAQYCTEHSIRFPPIFLTEYGVDLWNPEKDHGRGGFEGKGWKVALNGDATEYLKQLALFQDMIENDRLVKGATIFCSGDSGGWESFNVEGLSLPPEWRPDISGLEIGGDEMIIPNPSGPAFEAWWNAGGWKGYMLWLVATSQEDASLSEQRELLLDKLGSLNSEMSAFLANIPLQ